MTGKVTIGIVKDATDSWFTNCLKKINQKQHQSSIKKISIMKAIIKTSRDSFFRMKELSKDKWRNYHKWDSDHETLWTGINRLAH
ncbi:hypothetical protein LRR18_09190 [Mangrovimonas sp. AS39]|uniref:hypothetical protein n=1 Tax=Mangrovimonas futianensis TaxID=2895523 RepID=UPI001E28E009|nr:hypothetical protein [Mangrovimonas futianensis]MCF1191759.1 hypothetical protein [Mangrovimonas futianensis]